MITEIEDIDNLLFEKYKNKIVVDKNLTRQLVSFQANKKTPYYRWYKYKEGFSSDLVNYYINWFGEKKVKNILDPFAGSGTTLFASSERDIKSTGIELLPIGCEIINARITLQNDFNKEDYAELRTIIKTKPWNKETEFTKFEVLRITKGAYSVKTHKSIERYLTYADKQKDKYNQALKFALLCILESISFTRKDGQYLRWDHRSGRSGNFNKGKILGFNEAITKKLIEIVEDFESPQELSLFSKRNRGLKTYGDIRLLEGSCLEELPKIEKDSSDLIITSPPYANRYDYTRTYALELAMLGVSTEYLSELRQAMLSCTVENKEKNLCELNSNWQETINIVQKQMLLKKIIDFLEEKKQKKELNNNGLPRMIKSYFFELSCVIYELHRVLRKNGCVIMVNDNVRYAGVEISLDLILSDIAESIGFTVEQISILPNGKGNSSQQMGVHGRKALRKCVYIWRKR